MAAPMIKTRTPGVYKRGGRYVATWYANGKTYKRSARTLDEARKIRAARQAEVHAGEFQETSRQRFREYAEEWIERYRGRGRNGFRETTRDEYRRDLERYAYPYLDERLGRKLSAIQPRDIANWISWLCDPIEQGRRHAKEFDKPPHMAASVELADATVRRVVAPVRACLATARQEGYIRQNPAEGVSLPHRPRVDDGREKAKAFTREQLGAFLRVVNPAHVTMFRFLAATGLRWSEVCELRWADLELNGSRPCVRVRRRRVGSGARSDLGPPKSRHSRRDVPLETELVFELRRRRQASEWGRDDDLVFPNQAGKPLDYSATSRRVLKPAAEEAGAAWAGFHTFRHTCASLLFERGANAVKVQRWLGHHSPAFTLDTYVHLLDDQIDEPLELGVELKVGSKVATEATETSGNSPDQLDVELAALTHDEL